MNRQLKDFVPYVLAVLLFVVLSFAYFAPILEGKKLSQMDNIHAVGMAKELSDFEKQTGEKSMWTNSMFSGMPSYQIRGDASTNVFYHLNRVMRLGLPFTTVAVVFLYMLGFYLLLLSMKVDHWLSVVGAIAFAFGSYNFIIIVAGHVTKTYAIALMAPVIAGVLWSYNRNRWVGGLMTAVALGMQIAYNHLQITYYLLLLILVLGVVKLIEAIREKSIKSFSQTTGVLVLAAGLAILPNISNMWTTYEYGKFSNRGKSELAPVKGEKVHNGLDKEYAFAWSYGTHETLTLLIPNVVGGASKAIAQDAALLSKIDPSVKDFFTNSQYQGLTSQYWGGRAFTSGPVYAGAIVCFLFFLGAFYYKGKERWWLIAGTVLAIMLAWGKNFPVFNDFIFYHFPFYNKFRVVEMTLVIASFTIPVLGFLGLKAIYDKPELIKQDSKWFMVAFALTGGLSLLLYMMPTAFYSFISSDVANIFAQQKAQGGEGARYFSLVENELINARKALFQADALRSFIFILLASASIWFYTQNKLGRRYLIWGLCILILVDLWSVDKRYLNETDFVSKAEAKQEFVESACDKEILKDADLHYRVFTIYRNPFTEVNTSYFHKSIGGYHGAKLRRYQDVIDRYLMNDWQTLTATLQKAKSTGELEDALAKMPVLNMLNTKYLIYNPTAAPIFNPHYMGNAWFVNQIRLVPSADAELETIGSVNLATTAVVDERYKSVVAGYLQDSIVGSISLVSYAPNQLVYESNSTQEQLAVFSDVYYPKGWNSYIDGQKVDNIRVNYLLRALLVPAGKHTIEYKFEPISYKYGKTLALLSSLLVLVLVGVLVFWLRKKKE